MPVLESGDSKGKRTSARSSASFGASGHRGDALLARLTSRSRGSFRPDPSRSYPRRRVRAPCGCSPARRHRCGGQPVRARSPIATAASSFVSVLPLRSLASSGAYRLWLPSLSDEFSAQHCFGAEFTDENLLLHFTPHPFRGSLPEIEGELILDRETYELALLRYSYTSLPLPSVVRQRALGRPIEVVEVREIREEGGRVLSISSGGEVVQLASPPRNP